MAVCTSCLKDVLFEKNHYVRITLDNEVVGSMKVSGEVGACICHRCWDAQWTRIMAEARHLAQPFEGIDLPVYGDRLVKHQASLVSSSFKSSIMEHVNQGRLRLDVHRKVIE